MLRCLASALVLLTFAGSIHAEDIHLTRFLGSAAQTDAQFFASPGKGDLLVALGGPNTGLEVRLNGVTVFQANQLDGGDGWSLPNQIEVALLADNQIEVLGKNLSPGQGEIRISQQASVALHVGARVHFNTNVSNFEAARAFYGQLGFHTLSGFPDTNTRSMARAIGIYEPTSYDGSQGEEAGGYLLHGELIGVGGYQGGLIDLIEFKIPKSNEPPFQQLNRLGMVSAEMLTTDLDGDYAYLAKLGVNFLAPPIQRADGVRFAVFTDLDGTFYELVETAGGKRSDGPTQIVGLGALVVNVSDYKRSRAWYKMLGYREIKSLPRTDRLEVAQAMGFDRNLEVIGGVLEHPEDGSLLRLVQWRKPYDARPPYPLPVNHLGIHRTAFYTSDIAADVASLKAQGVTFVSEVTPCCSGDDSPGSIVAFFDPDGTVVELVEQPFMMEGLRLLGWFRETFLN